MQRAILFVLIGSMIALPSAGAAAKRQDQIDVCHVPKGNPDNAHAVTIAAAALDAHLNHGDAIFGVGLDRDCSGGLSFEIDDEIVPNTPTLPGLEGGAPRPVGVLVGPDGRRDELVENELELKPGGPQELDEFLATYRGEIVRGDVALIMNDDGELEERPGGGWYLLRIDPGASSLADLPALFAEAGVDGSFSFSSQATARTLAALLREGDRTLTPNLVLEPHAILDHPLVTGADPSMPTDFFDFADEWYMTEDDDPNMAGDQGLSIGVVRAWEYLRHTGLPPQDGTWEPARIAIVDNAFNVDPVTGEGNRDFLFNPPPQVDLTDYDGTADGPADSSQPWHGEGTFGVCCAYPRNLFGGAGRGGEYVRPIPIKAPLGFADLAAAIRTAWYMKADVINLSVGAQCNWLCDVADFFVESHMQEEIITATVMGTAVFASAGNGPGNMGITDFDIADGDWIPCEMSRVTCVGAVDRNGNNVWNWGNGVDIWAPTNTLSTLSPTVSPNAVGSSALTNFGGTSAASPFAAGIAGLLKTAVPDLQWNAVQQVLIDTANSSSDFRVSTGYVDALRAVQAVRGNPPPTVRFIFLDDGDTLSWARTGTFDAIATDDANPRGFVGHVEFRSNLDGLICETDVDSNVPFCSGRLSTLGNHVLTVIATDEFGASAQDSINVEVINRTPSVTLLSPEDGATRYSDQAVPLRASVVDFDGETFANACPAGVEQACVEWSSNIDGDLAPTSGEDPLNFARHLTPGTHVVTVTAIDGKGAMDQATATVTILEGIGVPTARILTPPQNTGRNVITVLEGTGTDPEDGTIDPSSYEWSSSIDGFLGTGSPLLVELSDGGCESIYEHTITLTVTDSNGNTDTDTVLIRVIVIC